MNWKMTTLTFFKYYTVYLMKSGQFFFHTYSLTCLNKDVLVLLSYKYLVKYKLTSNKLSRKTIFNVNTNVIFYKTFSFL